MKIILDGNAGDMGIMLNLAFQVQRSNPQQKLGESVVEVLNGKKFAVVKNQGSYTVKAAK